MPRAPPPRPLSGDVICGETLRDAWGDVDARVILAQVMCGQGELGSWAYGVREIVAEFDGHMQVG